ncbi:MAG: hypothetical protein IRY94_13100, partial [Rhodospirillaceae bacterium]|nr:hypothetical protein [Rhodospirillaceae bacterium]
ILVHVVAIGWLSLLMCGALFQFVLVLVARPLHSNVLPLPALFCLLAGLAALVLSFLQLAGRVASDLPFFPLAGALLGAGFALVLWTVARTLWAGRPLPLPARFVAVGLASVGATAGLGIIFALALGGATAYGPFLALTGAGLPVHVIAGLGGWLTFTAIGVSYRLLAMFMLAPELDRVSSRAALHLGTAALAVAILGGPAAVLLQGGITPVLAAAGLLGAAAVALYGGDVLHLYRARKRRKIELNSRMTALAVGSLGASVALAAALLALGRLTAHVEAVVFLAVFGWLSGLGLSQLHKIVAFLTWLECYGPVLGKTQTPRVQDLVVERRAAKWYLLYFPAVWAGAIALLAGHAAAFQASAGAMLLATVGIATELVRTRRLADVETAPVLPPGARRPRLLLALSRQT